MKIKCISSAQTYSDVLITKLYKGDKNIKELTIVEIGGPVDLSKIPQLDKPGKGNLFFLQKKYAGKDKVELEEDINDVK